MEERKKNERDAVVARFEARLLANLDALYNRALALTCSREESEDLVVETCVRAWRAFSNGGPERPRKGWLFSIMFAIAANERSINGRRPEVEAAKELLLKESAGFEAAIAATGSPIPSEPDSAWEGADVQRAVDRLPEELRDAVILVDFDQLTYEDAARVLRCPVNSLRSRLFQARRALFALLKENLPVGDGAGSARV